MVVEQKTALELAKSNAFGACGLGGQRVCAVTPEVWTVNCLDHDWGRLRLL
jgi:hypothetical protein